MSSSDRPTLFEFTLGEVLEEGIGGGCAGIFVGVVEWHEFGVSQRRRYGQISGEKARMKLQCWFWAIIAVSTTVTVASQVSKPAFEVASIKPQRTTLPAGPDARAAAVPRLRPGGVFNPSHATIETLLMFAYDQKQYQIVGEPEWARTAAYEINARAGTVAGAAQVKLMVQSLLEDRFNLLTHKEIRDMPFMALMPARGSRELGPYIRQLDDDCTPASARKVRAEFPPPQVTGGQSASGACAPLSTLADTLGLFSEVPVVDKTGWTGKFVYQLRAASLSPTPNPATDLDPNLPPLKEALAEQLGLKLEARRGPVDVLVIDSVQPPTEN